VIIIADCHTKALRRRAKGIVNKIFWPLKKFSFYKVNLAIISNVGMVKDVTELTKSYIILPDKIPEINVRKELDKKEKYCVYISSFAVDEPVREIFEAAKLLDSDIKLYWTGKIVKEKINGFVIPDNLKFTDYLSFDDYYKLIANADCILALTTEEDCLQSGAYEALSVETPMVISDTKALREFFLDAAVYTKHLPENIANNIHFAITNFQELIKKEIKLRELRNNEFIKKIRELKTLINKYETKKLEKVYN